MSLLWGLLAAFLLYWGVLLLLDRTGRLPAAVKTQGPIITIHTGRGRDFLNHLARPRRLWRAWGNFGIGVALIIMAGMFLVVVNSALAAMRSPERTAITEPRNVLVIPGVNEFLPPSVAPEIVLGLVVGLVVHEGGHGLLCRVENIDIDSMGIALLAIVPIGAFVEPDEASQRAADRGGKTRMFAAGVMNNFAITVLAFAALFGLVGAAVTVAPGAPVATAIEGSGADAAGIEPGDLIVGIGETQIESAADLDAYLQNSTERSVDVRLDNGESVRVERSLMVVAAAPAGPANLSLQDRITHVNDQRIHTQAGFETVAEEHPVLTVRTDDRTTRFPVGAYVPRVSPDGPLASTGIPTGEDHHIVITAIDDQRVISTNAARAVLGETTAGQEVEVTAYVYPRDQPVAPDASPETYVVTLGAHPNDDQGFLGVALQPGLTGLALNDFGTRYYPSKTFLASLGGGLGADSLFGLDSFFGRVLTALVLPIASFLGPGLEQNFPGFTGYISGFYEVHGAWTVLGAPVVFITANVLFWTAWINLNFGIFNCIPAFPLDGGHLLRSSTEGIVARLPVRNRYRVVKYVTISVGVAMLAGLLLMVFGQGLLV